MNDKTIYPPKIENRSVCRERAGKMAGSLTSAGTLRQDGGGDTRHTTHTAWETVSPLSGSCMRVLYDAYRCPSAGFSCTQVLPSSHYILLSPARNVVSTPSPSRPHHSVFFHTWTPHALHVRASMRLVLARLRHRVL